MCTCTCTCTCISQVRRAHLGGVLAALEVSNGGGGGGASPPSEALLAALPLWCDPLLALLKPALKELLHEEVSATSTSWKRIFPEPFGLAHEAALRQGPGFATDLDEATSDFLDWRARSPLARELLSEGRINATAAALMRQMAEKDAHARERAPVTT